jgi:hypothetical protein
MKDFAFIIVIENIKNPNLILSGGIQNKYKGAYAKIFDILNEDFVFTEYECEDEELIGNDFYVYFNLTPDLDKLERITKIPNVKIISQRYGQGGLIAPNGKLSNLNAEQYELVRTPAFKKWFGDWEKDPANSSKVVDENGEPLVVYRGMPKKRRFGNIFRYNVNMFGTTGVGSRKTNKFAFYFTDIKEVSDAYGRNLTDDDSEWIIKEYFLNIRNIFKAFTKKNEYELIFKKLYDLANKTGNKIYAKDSLGEIETNWRGNKIEWLDYYRMRDDYKNENYFRPVYSYFSDWNKDDENQAFWRVYLKDFLGYDGLVFYETTWNMDFDRNSDIASPRYGNEYSKTYAVFESNQIKIADGTNTTFDSENDDIRFVKGGEIDNFKDFYNELKIEDGSKYIGQKFSIVFPFLGKKRLVPNDYRIIVKQYNGVLSRLKENNYSSKSIRQRDLNKLERIKNNIDKKEFLGKFYLDSTGTIVDFEKNEFAKGGKIQSNIPDYLRMFLGK